MLSDFFKSHAKAWQISHGCIPPYHAAGNGIADQLAGEAAYRCRVPDKVAEDLAAQDKQQLYYLEKLVDANSIVQREYHASDEEPEHEPAPNPRAASVNEWLWQLHGAGHRLTLRIAAGGSSRHHSDGCGRAAAGTSAELRALLDTGPCVPKLAAPPAQQDPGTAPAPRFSGRHVLHP